MAEPSKSHVPGVLGGLDGQDKENVDGVSQREEAFAGHLLRVDGVIQETADAHTLVLAVPSPMRKAFRWIPGQHVTVGVYVDGAFLQRCYSLSGRWHPADGPPSGDGPENAPDELSAMRATTRDWGRESPSWHPGNELDGWRGTVSSEFASQPDAPQQNALQQNNGPVASFTHDSEGPSLLRITVKGVDGGRVSGALRRYRPGQVLRATPPAGVMRLRPSPWARRTYYLIGAGSGITPLYAMAQAVLFHEPYSRVHLLYGNRDHRSVIFYDALGRLREHFPRCLTVHHVWSQDHAGWRKGRIDTAAVHAFLDASPPYAQDTRYYLCGPGEMNAVVKNALQQRDVPCDRIHREQFDTAGASEEAAHKGIAAQIILQTPTGVRSFPVAADQTILEGARAANITIPASCEGGICGTCRAQRIDGKTMHRRNLALDKSEVEGGAVLTCQAVAKSSLVRLRME